MKAFLVSLQMAIVVFATHSYALELAPLEKALSLAQFEQAGQTHTLLVLADNGAEVTGIDISARSGFYPDDSFDLVGQLGYETLVQYASAEIPKLSLPYAALLPQSGTSRQHIGAGINYPEHGEETGQETRPFVFPKIVQATGSREIIAFHSDQLLDYEVELCARFDQDIAQPEDIETAMVGLFLCGDFTDRALLMRLIDTSNVQSGIGFTDAKSQQGFFPTGPYLVVPQNWRNFLKEIRLQLSVNNELKQDSYASEMVLSTDKLAAKALESGAESESRWQFEGAVVPLLPDKLIEKGMAILTGTPEGVIFRPPSSGFKFRSILQYIFTASFLRGGPTQYVIEQYIEENILAKNYLQPGDMVIVGATYLGNIQIEISSVPKME